MRIPDYSTHTGLTIILLLLFLGVGAVNYHLMPIDSSYFYWTTGAFILAAFLAGAVYYRKSPRRVIILMSLGILLYTCLDYSFISVQHVGKPFSEIFLCQSALVVLGFGCLLGYYLGNGHNLVRLMIANAGIIVCQIIAVINEMFILYQIDRAYSLLIASLPDMFLRIVFIIYLARPEFAKIAIETRLRTHMMREFHLVMVCVLVTALVIAEEAFLIQYPEFIYFEDTLDIAFVGAVICWIMMVLAVIYKDDKRKSTIFLMTGVMAFTALSYKITLDIEGNMWALFYSVQSVLVNFCVILSFACIFGYFLGYIHNVTRLVMLTGIIIGLMMMPWFVWRYIEHDLQIAEIVLVALLPTIMIRVLMISYLVRPDVIDMSIGTQLKMRLNRVESTQIMDNMSFMEREDMDALLDPSSPRWVVLPEGPVERYYVASIKTPTKRHYQVVARIWRGEDFIRCKLSPEKDARGSWGMDFDIVEHRFYKIEDKDIVRIYGHDGMFVDIYAENPRIHKENKISDVLDRIIREY